MAERHKREAKLNRGRKAKIKEEKFCQTQKNEYFYRGNKSGT